MKYELPELPETDEGGYSGRDSPDWDLHAYSAEAMRQYAEQAVAPLLAEIERLEDLLFEATQRDNS